jgi:hypothetical protein
LHQSAQRPIARQISLLLLLIQIDATFVLKSSTRLHETSRLQILQNRKLQLPFVRERQSHPMNRIFFRRY